MTSPTASPVLDLQRLAGNRAVCSLLATDRGSPVAQRAKAGWTGADTSGSGWNVTDREVKGTKIRRVPVEGIKLGNQQDFAAFGDEREMTTESAAGRAIVLFSEAFDAAAEVEVMLHFHGYDFRKGTDPHAGWRQDKDDQTVRDVDQDRVEQQMDASGATQTLAVLPQGVGKSSFGDMPWNDYVREVLKIVATMGFPQVKKAPESFRLILSAHSGGGFTVTPALAYDKKHKRFTHEPANLTEIVLFEALHGDAADVVATWAEVHMARVRDAGDDNRDTALAACPRLRAYYSKNGLYVRPYTALAGRLDGWLSHNRDALGPKLHAQLAARFQVHALDGTSHETVVRGLGDDPSAGPIADALRAADDPDAPSHLLEKGTATWSAHHGAGKGHPKAAHVPPADTAPKTGSTATPAPVPAPPARKKAAKARGEIPAGAIRGDRLGSFGKTDEEAQFRRDVYEKQLREVVARGKEFFPGLGKDEKGSVDGFPIHKQAEADARQLLVKAREDLAARRKLGDAAALRCDSVGVNNAYRSLEHDFDAWQGAFKTAYKKTTKARNRPDVGGPLSDKAVDIMVNYLVDSKAIPGFSNHTRGLAIDFTTKEDGNDLGPAHAQDAQWADSWFHHWLADNAHAHHFQAYSKEYWHWDHETAPNGATPDAQHPDASKTESVGGSTGGGSAPAPATATPASGAPPHPAPAHHRGRAHPEGSEGGGTPPAHHADAAVTLSWGSHARKDVVAESSLEILRDVLGGAGLRHATITSTARTAADQARAMYQNLIGKGKGQGVAAQHRLYGPAGDAVVDTFVELRDKGLSAEAIRDGMRAKIEELGPGKVSRHCADPTKLNVIDLGPNSLGGEDAQAALVAAAQAEEGRRISKFIPYPKDPGDHFEIPPA